jgi:hypothetical protein
MTPMNRSLLLSCLLLLTQSCRPECAVSSDCTDQQQCVDGACVPSAQPVIDVPSEGEGEFGVAEGEGEFGVAEGEGEFGVAEGEGEFGVAEGEGEFGVAEGEGEFAAEGEGEAPVGEGEGEGEPCAGACNVDEEVCIDERCTYDGLVCDAVFFSPVIGVSTVLSSTMTTTDPYASFAVGALANAPRRVQRFDINTNNVSSRLGTDLLVDVLAADTTFDTLAAAYTNGTCTELASNDDFNGELNHSRFTVANVARGDLINVMVGGFNDSDVGEYTLTVQPSLCGAPIADATTYDQCARGFDNNTNAVCGTNNPCARTSAGALTGFACCTRADCGATPEVPVFRIAVSTGCGP